MNNSISFWENYAQKHKTQQLINPFSNWDGAGCKPTLNTSDKNYGKPKTGSLTEKRGKDALQHISAEIIQLCQVIEDNCSLCASGKSIKFALLFNIYTNISNKLVGLLVRARKNHLVYFEGEMLFQGIDDNKDIFLNTNWFEITQERAS